MLARASEVLQHSRASSSEYKTLGKVYASEGLAQRKPAKPEASVPASEGSEESSFPSRHAARGGS